MYNMSSVKNIAMILDDGKEKDHQSTTTTKTEELGYFGNIWVRQHSFEKSGDHIEGHKHYFDHVSLLVRGSVSVQIPGEEEKIFHAPTFIVIRKGVEHLVIAKEDDTVWYCVFAIRNPLGEVVDDEEIVGAVNDPSNKSHEKFNAQTFDASDAMLELLREKTILETKNS